MIMNEEFRRLWHILRNSPDIWLERLKETKKGPTDNTDQLGTLIFFCFVLLKVVGLSHVSFIFILKSNVKYCLANKLCANIIHL